MSENASALAAVCWQPPELQDRLTSLAGLRVTLLLTENRCSMLSYRRRGATLEVRMHRRFLHAPPEVIEAAGRFLAGRSGSRRLLRAFFAGPGQGLRIASGPTRRIPLHTQGRFHDLGSIRGRINRLYLGDRSQAQVTWGRTPVRRATRTVRLGWYDPERRLIVISRRLDAAEVPCYMVEYVMFHEMLHEVVGIGSRPDGTRKIHGPTFRLLEETFPDYDRARRFERRRWG